MTANRSLHPVIWILLLLSPGMLCAQPLSSAERARIAGEIEKSIKTSLLNVWYPRVIDQEYGGFLTTFTYDFKATGPQDKMIVTQARHVWTSAKASRAYPDVDDYKRCARHGFAFLRDVMWDQRYGGFYTLVDRQGNVKGERKSAYGNAFGLYALAAYYQAFGDTAALNLAKETFRWLEKHSHDPVYKGYYQHLNRDGSIVKRSKLEASTADTGYKDQNSSIHLLEALTELYQVWPDDLVRERLEEMLTLIRDTITTDKGYLVLFFQPDWTPVSFRDSSEAVILKHRNLDHVSFGHDVETAYLMLEASHVAGIRNDMATQRVARKMVDHALRNGWDKRRGGFYDEGYYFRNKPGVTIIRDSKNWWAQAEGLNTLLLMAANFPKDKMLYAENFTLLWKYINTYLIDHQHGEWYQGGLDKEPAQKTGLKGHIWKASYHQYRALSNCLEKLRDDSWK
jgi:mannobiose 2-epimerase